MQSGSLLLRMQDGYRTATLLNTDVSITVSGLVARVSVMQQFENASPTWAEGIYVFPLPDRAAVDRMRLYVGDRLIEGEIREKAEARKTYEAAKQAGQKTSLVEQQRANLFTTSVANIAAGEMVVVEIEYLEDIRYDAGTFSMRVPMTLTPRYMPGRALPDRQGSGWAPDTTQAPDASLISPPMVSASQGHEVSLRASIDAGMPLELIASRYHPVHIAETGGRYTVVLAGDRVPMDHDFEFLWRPVTSSVPRAMTFGETIAGDGYYLLMVVPPDAADRHAAGVPRDTIFIIDTSGSMHGVSLAQAKQALLRALDGLDPGDRFNVIEFNSHARGLFGSSMPADAMRVEAARHFVRRLESTGGTEMYPALELALAMPADESHLRQIVFITDGAVGNEEALFELIETRLGGARLFTVGIGSAPNSWFMRKAAEAGRGTFTTIGALHEVAEKMDVLFRKLEQPQVTDIEVEWPGGVLVESYPGVVPDLYSGEPVTVRARAVRGFRPGDSVRIAGDSASGAWAQDLALDAVAPGAGIGALWARARIADLLDARRRGADPGQVRRDIVATALAHHIVSPHTSLVAVDRTPVRPAGDPLGSGQVPNLMPYGQSMEAIFGFPATATNAAGLVGSGLLLIAAALLLTISTRLVRGAQRGFAA
jgi:Ca-activated chloride channel family protein